MLTLSLCVDIWYILQVVRRVWVLLAREVNLHWPHNSIRPNVPP